MPSHGLNKGGAGEEILLIRARYLSPRNIFDVREQLLNENPARDGKQWEVKPISLLLNLTHL